VGGAITAALILGLTGGFLPGPLLTAVLSQTLRHGVREGIRTSFAPLLTDGPIIAILLVFLHEFARVRPLLGAIAIIGAAYLLWMAWESWHSKAPDARAVDAPPRSLLRGALVNFANPNMYVFWITVGVPTLTKAWSSSVLAAIAFVVVFFACLIGSKIAIVLLAGRSRALLSGSWYRAATRLLAAMLVVYAALMMRDGVALLR
jgi:threonine/homoserine/homoserine lactone efflux protein